MFHELRWEMIVRFADIGEIVDYQCQNQHVHASNLGTNVFKSGVLKNVFILSKHGTKANIRSTKNGK
jgi:hypothetical protein